MRRTDLLLLVPTRLELEQLKPRLPAWLPVELCGFGLIASGIRTAGLLADPSRQDVQRVILVGMGGSLCGETWPVGTAGSFGLVRCQGIGAWSGQRLLGPRELGFSQCQTAAGDPVTDHLDLLPLDHRSSGAGLLSVAAASGTTGQAAERAGRFSGCVCEDMEGFAVALAARQAGCATTVVRGISNVAGDRHRDHWQIEPALQAAAQLLLEQLPPR